MPKAKNLGPCVIPDCKKAVAKFNKVTNYAIEKIRDKDSEKRYDFIKEGDQLCITHYLEIVVPDRHYKETKRKSLESLKIECSKNARVKTDDEPSSSESIDKLNWSKIDLNFTEENVVISKDDLSLLVNSVNQIKLQLDSISYHIDEREVSNVDITDKENIVIPKDDFSLLVNNVNQMKLQLDSISYHIDEHEDYSVDITDKDVDDGEGNSFFWLK